MSRAIEQGKVYFQVAALLATAGIQTVAPVNVRGELERYLMAMAEADQRGDRVAWAENARLLAGTLNYAAADILANEAVRNA